MEIKYFTLPLTEDQLNSISAGDIISLSGTVYTARDMAHKRICASLSKGNKLPFPLLNACIYYCGPTPAREGEVIGSCGPTTSGRMDDYAPALMEEGLKIMIGKGRRSGTVITSLIKNKCLYLLAVGGAAALYKNCVKACELVAYPDLGCEAVYRLTIENMELIAGIDSRGNSIV